MLPKILRSLSPIALVAAAFNFVAPAPLVAQATSSLVTTRLTQPIDENARVTLKGTVHPLASAANDRGAAPNSMPLSRLTLVLKRSDAQESALKQLISDLHTPGSASYHKWLTPDAFGKQFGPSDQDLATIQSWLASQGFSVTKVNAGRQSLEFSGNVSQFRAAFHTQIHKYMVNGETHYANSTDPQIPAALAPVVTGFASLNNFRARSPMRLLGHALWNPQTHQATPQWTYPVGTGENFAIAPGDFAMQYDVPNSSLNPSYTGTTYDGTGQTIAIVNESNINIAAVNAFRSTLVFPPTLPRSSSTEMIPASMASTIPTARTAHRVRPISTSSGPEPSLPEPRSISSSRPTPHSKAACISPWSTPFTPTSPRLSASVFSVANRTRGRQETRSLTIFGNRLRLRA